MKYLLLAAMMAFSVNAFADETKKRESVDELMQLIDADSMVDAMFMQMGNMLNQMSSEMKITPNEQEIYQRFNDKITTLIRKEMGWDKMKGPMTEVYINTFEQNELDGMIKFYKSEVGQATLKKLPIVMQQSMQVGQTIAQQQMPQIQQLSLEFKEELKKFRAENESK